MSAREVYLAADPVNAEIAKDVLVNHGIGAHVRNQYLWGGMGDLPANVYPSVWVDEADDYDAARALIRDFERGALNDGRPWQCSACGEYLDAQFQQCWNCETLKPAD
ncbi:Zinc-finger-like domain-containing protein [Salinisphaera shabanensis E1L3A]|jgi:hypothetical protein|uniref:Zinc-finger-like domain-containing protein n=1 Tax=Salinisphaera shabanensis E1L3A TaxID=1033802 RepID=U2EKX9_9GAMM|nr:DUF2007 domain-containing protein [Salinisphaera shabanensis]ERJ18580.1 Zinc-finger-like domain-containing protein [Salinisphaera shabanensis E1L3A]|tara:strand:- start:363 stop:683 length:321 start_codon:yes stop_codon:yes gene_type:complete